MIPGLAAQVAAFGAASRAAAAAEAASLPPRLAARVRAVSAVSAALQQGPAQIGVLMQRTGLRPHQVRDALRQMESSGALRISLGRGGRNRIYALVAGGA